MSSITVLPPGEDGFARKKWSVSECRFLVENDMLAPGKLELIDGEILFKMGQGRLHIYVVAQIIAVLTAIFGDCVQSQAQIGIGQRNEFSDPEPDAAILRGALRDYLNREPDPATKVLLVVEASDTTLKGDTSIKAPLYAHYGVCEYWVVAISRRELIVHRQPGAEGYADVQTYSENASVAPLSRPDASIPVASLLP